MASKQDSSRSIETNYWLRGLLLLAFVSGLVCTYVFWIQIAVAFVLLDSEALSVAKLEERYKTLANKSYKFEFLRNVALNQRRSSEQRLWAVSRFRTDHKIDQQAVENILLPLRNQGKGQRTKSRVIASELEVQLLGLDFDSSPGSRNLILESQLPASPCLTRIAVKQTANSVEIAVPALSNAEKTFAKRRVVFKKYSQPLIISVFLEQRKHPMFANERSEILAEPALLDLLQSRNLSATTLLELVFGVVHCERSDFAKLTASDLGLQFFAESEAFFSQFRLAGQNEKYSINADFLVNQIELAPDPELHAVLELFICASLIKSQTDLANGRKQLLQPILRRLKRTENLALKLRLQFLQYHIHPKKDTLQAILKTLDSNQLEVVKDFKFTEISVEQGPKAPEVYVNSAANLPITERMLARYYDLVLSQLNKNHYQDFFTWIINNPAQTESLRTIQFSALVRLLTCFAKNVKSEQLQQCLDFIPRLPNWALGNVVEDCIALAYLFPAFHEQCLQEAASRAANSFNKGSAYYEITRCQEFYSKQKN